MRALRALLCLALLSGTARATSLSCIQEPNFACKTTDDTIAANWTMGTGKSLTLSNLGASFTASDTNPSCGAGVYGVYADLSETKLKKCQNGTLTDLDTATGVLWDTIGNPAGNQTLSMANTVTSWVWGNATGTNPGLDITDTASNSGTGVLVRIITQSGSGMKPFEAAISGGNGVLMDTAGVLQALGSGGIRATDLNLPGTEANGDVPYFNGANWVFQATHAANTVLHGNGAGAPTFSAIVSADITDGTITGADISDTGFLVWNETASGTWPAKTVTNAPRTKDTFLVVNNGVTYLRRTTVCGGQVNEYNYCGVAADCTGVGAPCACCGGSGNLGTCSATTITMCDATDEGTVVVTYERS